jgi:hypothetical protein
MADRYIKPISAVFTSNSIGNISQFQILSVFDNSQNGKITSSVGVPWFLKLTYDLALTFPAGTWISQFHVCTSFGIAKISYNNGSPISKSGAYWLGNQMAYYFNINNFVSNISFGGTGYGTGGGYNLYYLLAQGNSDSGLRVRGKDNRVYWIGTDPNSPIKIRNKSGQIVGLDYGSASDSRASPCRFTAKNGTDYSLRYIKKV